MEEKLLIATGSNQGDSLHSLQKAKLLLSEQLNFEEESLVYFSQAVDVEEQPPFLNQVLQFALPSLSPEEVLSLLLTLEKTMGRVRKGDRGPRFIDLDILFYGMQQIDQPGLTIPHPRWGERSFVVLPLQELSFGRCVLEHFSSQLKPLKGEARPYQQAESKGKG